MFFFVSMWKMMSSYEEMNKLWFHSIFIYVINNYFTDKIFSWAGPTMEAKNKGFVRMTITKMSF